MDLGNKLSLFIYHETLKYFIQEITNFEMFKHLLYRVAI